MTLWLLLQSDGFLLSCFSPDVFEICGGREVFMSLRFTGLIASIPSYIFQWSFLYEQVGQGVQFLLTPAQ